MDERDDGTPPPPAPERKDDWRGSDAGRAPRGNDGRLSEERASGDQSGVVERGLTRLPPG